MSASWGVRAGPGLTALGLAAARSVETSRPDRLVEDPFAAKLFLAAKESLPMHLVWPGPHQPLSDTEKLHLHGSRYIGLRTRVYDDALEAAAAEGIGQAVLLGAGLDTRAYRLELAPSLHLFELDQPDVLAYKETVLAGEAAGPRSMRTAVGVDLRGDWPSALRLNGFAPDRATIWIAEGVLPYLASSDQLEVIDHIATLSASHSRLALDTIGGDPRADGRLRSLSERSGLDMERLIAGGAAVDLERALLNRGWKVERTSPVEQARRYSRDLSDPFARTQDASATEPPWLETSFLFATHAGR